MDKSAPLRTATAWCFIAPAVFLNVMLTATNPGPTTAGKKNKKKKLKIKNLF